MDAMLMGGIIPNAISVDAVDRYLATNTRRKKRIQYGTHKFSANNWKEVLLSILKPEYYHELLGVLTRYLRTASNYAVTGGPRAAEALALARNMIGSATQPIPQLIVRIIRDMRTVRPSIKKVRRQMFIREQDPIKALSYMQFIPSIGIYDDRITAVPTSLSRKLTRYSQDPELRARAAARALMKARKITGVPNYVPDYGTDALTQQVFSAVHNLNPLFRQRMRWTKGANPKTARDVLARLEEGRKTASKNLQKAIVAASTIPNYYGKFNIAGAARAPAAAQGLNPLSADYIPSSPLAVPESPELLPTGEPLVKVETATPDAASLLFG